MHGHRSQHEINRSIAALWIGVLLAACCAATASGAGSATRSGLAGTWSGKYSGAYNGTFVLRWRQSGSKLTGSIKLSRPAGTYPITGSVRGTTIRFGAVAAGATYTGSWSGKSMSGSYATGRGTGKWSARKVS